MSKVFHIDYLRSNQQTQIYKLTRSDKVETRVELEDDTKMMAQRFKIMNSAIPLAVSASFVLGILYALVTLDRLNPVWNPHQQLLLATTILHVSKNAQNSAESEALSTSSPCSDKSPPVWPHAFVIAQLRVPDIDSRVSPSTTITYYDYDQGGNLIQDYSEAPGKSVLWDLELNNEHSYYFYPSEQSCKSVNMPVGLLRPNWLEGATPLGPSWSTWRRAPHDSIAVTSQKALKTKKNEETDRLVCGWTKLDFIDYYVDAETGEPDSWYFHSMKASFRVLNYTVVPSNTIDPALFVPPDYCFS